MSWLKTWLTQLWQGSWELNHQNILHFLGANPRARLLDLGCDDGSWTTQLGQRVGTHSVFGVDVADGSLCRARELGVAVVHGDLNQPLPFASETCDIVHANQVIEHLIDVDTFAEEIYRVLRWGSYAIISTENLASWADLAALLLGRQAFSQHISARHFTGNPFAIHSGEAHRENWTHVKIFTFHGLRDFLRLYRFEIVEGRGAGHYPFPTRLAAVAGRLDPGHAHFITVKARKAAGAN